MVIPRILIISCFFAALAFAQTKQKPELHRRDNITVYAGESSKQGELEEECDAKIKQAEGLTQQGEAAKALDLLNVAWKMNEEHTFLKNRQ